MAWNEVDHALQRDLQANLSKDRFRHVERVVETIVRLANQHGLPPEPARTAAWLHDLAREWPRDRLLDATKFVEVPDGFAAVPALLHGPIAAHIGRVEYGILDEEILDAVRYHTTGRPDMTQLDLLLFVADAIEPGRHYPGVEEIRKWANVSLEQAAKRSLDGTVAYLLHADKPLFPLTIVARNALLEKLT